MSNNTKIEIMIKGAELSSKLNSIGVVNEFGKKSEGKQDLTEIIDLAITALDDMIIFYVDGTVLVIDGDVEVNDGELIL